MSVAEAFDRELAELRERDEGLAGSALAASTRVLAEQLDDPCTSATSKSMCARELRAALEELRDLAPLRREKDGIDDLADRRDKRRRDAARRSDAARPADS